MEWRGLVGGLKYAFDVIINGSPKAKNRKWVPYQKAEQWKGIAYERGAKDAHMDDKTRIGELEELVAEYGMEAQTYKESLERLTKEYAEEIAGYRQRLSEFFDSRRSSFSINLGNSRQMRARESAERQSQRTSERIASVLEENLEVTMKYNRARIQLENTANTAAFLGNLWEESILGGTQTLSKLMAYLNENGILIIGPGAAPSAYHTFTGNLGVRNMDYMQVSEVLQPPTRRYGIIVNSVKTESPMELIERLEHDFRGVYLNSRGDEFGEILEAIVEYGVSTGGLTPARTFLNPELSQELLDFYHDKKVVLIGPPESEAANLRSYFSLIGIQLIIPPKDKQNQLYSAIDSGDVILFGDRSNHEYFNYSRNLGKPTYKIFHESRKQVTDALLGHYSNSLT